MNLFYKKHLYGTKLTPLQRYKCVSISTKKTFIIDNIKNNYINYTDNGINIIDFRGCGYDYALHVIKHFLIKYSNLNDKFSETSAPMFLKKNYHLIITAIADSNLYFDFGDI